MAQGGVSGGHSLYLKGGKPIYCYNFFGLERYYVEGDAGRPARRAPGAMEFAYDGGGFGKGGLPRCTSTASRSASGRIEQTEAFLFSADETCDVGDEYGSPVTTTTARSVHRPVNWVEIDSASTTTTSPAGGPRHAGGDGQARAGRHFPRLAGRSDQGSRRVITGRGLGGAGRRVGLVPLKGADHVPPRQGVRGGCAGRRGGRRRAGGEREDAAERDRPLQVLQGGRVRRTTRARHPRRGAALGPVRQREPAGRQGRAPLQPGAQAARRPGVRDPASGPAPRLLRHPAERAAPGPGAQPVRDPPAERDAGEPPVPAVVQERDAAGPGARAAGEPRPLQVLPGQGARGGRARHPEHRQPARPVRREQRVRGRADDPVQPDAQGP